MSLSSDIHEWFVKRGFLWKIGADRHIPSEQDITDALARIKTIMDDPEIGSLEVGRLLAVKDGEKVSMYVYYGDLDESS